MTLAEHITPIVKLNLRLQCFCDYKDTYMLAKGTITVVVGADKAARQADRNNRQ